MVDQEIKVQLLQLLYKNSRSIAEELADQLKLSRQTISKVRQSLWDKGTIHNPTLLLNPQALNLQYFFMEIKTNPAEPELLALLKSIPEIISIDGVLGDYALIVKLEARTKQEFSKILHSMDQNIARTMFQSYRIIETLEVFKLGGVILNRNLPFKQLSDEKWQLLKLLTKNYNPNKWPERHPQEFFSGEQAQYLEKLNLSREFDQFIADNLIERFTITMNPIMPDFKMKYFMRIKPNQVGDYTELAEMLINEPNITELYRTGEDSGLLAIIRTKGVESFRDFIKLIYQKYPIRDTHTTVVVEEHIPSIYPPTFDAAKAECSPK